MVTFVHCKICNKRIPAEKPSGNVKASGNVRYSGVQFEGSSIKFGPGGGINFGEGGSISFGNPTQSSIRCPHCFSINQYSINDFHDE